MFIRIIFVASTKRSLNVVKRFAFRFGYRTPYKYRTQNSERGKYEKRFANTYALANGRE